MLEARVCHGADQPLPGRLRQAAVTQHLRQRNRQIAAGFLAHQREAQLVHLQLPGVLEHPDCRIHRILGGGRERMVGRQRVGRRHHHGRNRLRQIPRQCLCRFHPTFDETARVQVHQPRQQLGAARRRCIPGGIGHADLDLAVAARHHILLSARFSLACSRFHGGGDGIHGL
ncbi:hypothetical protein D3C81_1616900 [compost metagenome]